MSTDDAVEDVDSKFLVDLTGHRDLFEFHGLALSLYTRGMSQLLSTAKRGRK